MLPLTKRLIAIVDSITPALRCLPTVVFGGPVESTVNPTRRDLEAVLREALSNVARHARRVGRAGAGRRSTAAR